jgi:hypothetical protein
MAANPSAPVPDSGTTPRPAGASVRRELLIFAIAVASGLLVLPILIWLVGNRILGPYTHTQDATAGTGPMRLLADYFTGLAHGSLIFWCVALGPYILITLARALWSLLRSTPAAPHTHR